jgi:hypothetical protein
MSTLGDGISSVNDTRIGVEAGVELCSPRIGTGGSGSDVPRPRSAVIASIFGQKAGEWQHLIA